MKQQPAPRWIVWLLAMTVAALLGACRSREPLYQQELTGPWYFAVDPHDQGIADRWFMPTFDRSRWRRIPQLGLWDHYNLQNYDGSGWYACLFELPPLGRPEMALIFSGVDDNADVWVNGRAVGSHAGANMRFVINITGHTRQGDNWLVVRVTDTGGPGGLNGTVSLRQFNRFEEVQRGPLAALPAPDSPDWVRRAVIYEVYVRNFSADGSFAGLQARLPELKELGVTVIWLMPIHPIGKEKRKGRLGSPYSVSDYYKVNPEFGTFEDFKNLVRAAHALELRIILDMVANHTAWDHPWLQQHPEWYTRDERGRVVSPVEDWSDVADLNYDNPNVRRAMNQIMRYWVRETDVDGFRCDVAELVPLDFWQTTRSELNKLKPLLMLAEGEKPELHVNGFDLTYAWNVYKALVNIFEKNGSARLIHDALRDEAWNFPRNSLRLRFTCNHDENAWRAPAIKLFGPEGAKAAAVLTVCLPGVPLLYNGQEVGHDEPLPLFEKAPIQWHEDRFAMRPFYRELLRARRDTPALIEGEMEWVSAGAEDAVVAFYRRHAQGDVLVAVNLKGTAQQVRWPMSPPAVEKVFGNGSYQGGQVDLPPYGYLIAKAR
ncbi:MAG: alpha-amylase family glycosyl hydrolase [Acidobacteriota bacterium]|nr:alpha-amylase family glycosyl hydrolase [Acidobacteriota bacterium]